MWIGCGFGDFDKDVCKNRKEYKKDGRMFNDWLKTAIKLLQYIKFLNLLLSKTFIKKLKGIPKWSTFLMKVFFIRHSLAFGIALWSLWLIAAQD